MDLTQFLWLGIECHLLFVAGFGGGFNDRQDVEYNDRESSEDEIDDVMMTHVLHWSCIVCIFLSNQITSSVLVRAQEKEVPECRRR